MAHSRATAMKEYFGTPEKPVTNSELIQFAREDKPGYEEIGDLCIGALGQTKD